VAVESLSSGDPYLDLDIVRTLEEIRVATVESRDFSEFTGETK
jgi:hypothetical protein